MTWKFLKSRHFFRKWVFLSKRSSLLCGAHDARYLWGWAPDNCPVRPLIRHS